ncbi:MAG: glycerol-3-phosphate 1-O-acyltransferase PlsY [Alphaproteobacteria bacterium]
MNAFIFIFFIIAYLIGSVPFGLILTKAFTGQDLRTIGSRNIGTTNVLRTGNKFLAFSTLLCDMGKGGVPALFAYGIFPDYQNSGAEYSLLPPIALIIGLGAILGHCFPIWLKFKGGKGVATMFGVFLAAVPYSGLVALATWLAVAVSTRYSSLSALCACAIAPIITFFIYGALPAGICALIAGLIFLRHKDNIRRLLAGEENKIGQRRNDKTDARAGLQPVADETL